MPPAPAGGARAAPDRFRSVAPTMIDTSRYVPIRSAALSPDGGPQMHVRVLLVPALLLALCTPAVAAPRAPALAGTTRVTVTRSTVLDVRLPRTVTIGAQGIPKGASVTGDGRIVGAMLLSADKSSLASYLLLRYGLCTQPGCKGTPSYLYSQVRSRSAPPSTSETLPAGA